MFKNILKTFITTTIIFFFVQSGSCYAAGDNTSLNSNKSFLSVEDGGSNKIIINSLKIKIMKKEEQDANSNISASKISEKKVSFKSNNITIAAILFYNEANFSTSKPGPAIIVGHPGSGVKEQTAGLYAKRLAEKGFITLTFDCAYQGESEGMPRGLEDPAQRVEDFKSAVSFLSTIKEVDVNNIGVLGICASGAYVLAAASSDHRIKAVATVSAVDMGKQWRVGGDGKQDPAVFQHLLDLGATDRTAVANGHEQGYMKLFPETGEEARALAGEHGFEGWEYYCTTRAENPRSQKYFAYSSFDRIADFDAFKFVEYISPRPILMIVGSEAVTSWMTKEAMDKAKEPKEVYVINGASHVALYDKDQYVSPAVEKLKNFFDKNLK